MIFIGSKVGLIDLIQPNKDIDIHPEHKWEVFPYNLFITPMAPKLLRIGQEGLG